MPPVFFVQFQEENAEDKGLYICNTDYVFLEIFLIMSPICDTMIFLFLKHSIQVYSSKNT